MKHKFPYYLSVGIIALAGLILLYVFFLLFFPYKTVDLKEPVKILNENHQVVRGGDLILEIEYEKFGNYKAEVNKNIICDDGNLVTLANNTTNFPSGKQKLIVRNLVPEKTSLGICHLQYVNIYSVNLIRDITKVWVTEDFKVVKEWYNNSSDRVINSPI